MDPPKLNNFHDLYHRYTDKWCPCEMISRLINGKESKKYQIHFYLVKCFLLWSIYCLWILCLFLHLLSAFPTHSPMYPAGQAGHMIGRRGRGRDWVTSPEIVMMQAGPGAWPRDTWHWPADGHGVGTKYRGMGIPASLQKIDTGPWLGSLASVSHVLIKQTFVMNLISM